MLLLVALVRTNVSEECIVSITRLTRIEESESITLRLLLTANIVPNAPILVMLMMETIHSSETSVLIRARWSNIPEGGILQSSLFFQGIIYTYIYI
jgi:hypothetical protein